VDPNDPGGFLTQLLAAIGRLGPDVERQLSSVFGFDIGRLLGGSRAEASGTNFVDIPDFGAEGGTGGPPPSPGGGEVDQDQLMAQIIDIIKQTGELPTELFPRLSASNRELAVVLWGAINEEQRAGDQFTADAENLRKEIIAKKLQNEIKNALAEGRLEEAKRTNRARELFEQRTLGFNALKAQESTRQFETQLRQTKLEFELKKTQAANELAFMAQQLSEGRREFDIEERRRVAELEETIRFNTKSLENEARGLTIKEAFNQEQIAVSREQLAEGQRQFGLVQAQEVQLTREEFASQERQTAIRNPFGSFAANVLGLGTGSGDSAGGQAPFQQGLSSLGFGIPSGAQAGQFTPSNQFFSGGLPTLGALSQAGPTAQAAVQPFLSFTGTSPEDFQRQSAAVTPRTR